MTRDATTAFARALVDEWARAGVHEACLAPGSRSAPLALALAAHDRIRVHVHLDERSAAFFALGTAKASGSPAVVLCTSGTAAANFHPAVLEASHSRTPLIVCTADRPPELRDTGAGQTVDQLDLYGRAVHWFCEVGVPEDHPSAAASWRSAAARAVAESVDRVARAAGWPVLADPISGVRQGGNSVSTYEALLRSPRFAERHRPELVLRLGAAPTSKPLSAWLGPEVPQLLVDPDGAWLDPRRGVAERLAVDPEPLLAALADALASAPERDQSWLRSWQGAERAARAALDDLLDGWETLFEGRVARDTVDALPDGATLVVASSMPVRDVEAFARPRSGVHFLANRGVNGIDGFVSTVLGAAAASPGPTIALVGDLCLLHDASGLLGAAGRGVDATFVVLDNDGGGIFSFLPQAEQPEHFELLFGTPHGVDLAALPSMHGLPADRVEKAGEVVPAVEAAIAAGGVRFVIVPTERADNVRRHRDAWRAVASAL